MNHIASIDVGTTNIKINLFNKGHEVVGAVKYPQLKIHSTNDIFEMDLDEIWEHILDGLNKLIERHQVGQLEIILTTAMHSVQLMEYDFNLVGSVITWADKRGVKALEDMTAKQLEDQYERTGTPNHSMNPYFKLMDLRDLIEEDIVVGSLKDVLFHRLTGEWVLDLSNASSSGLLNLDTLTWDKESLNTLGIDAEKQLPRIEAVNYNVPALSSLFDIEATVSVGTSDGISSNYVFRDLPNAADLSIGTSHAVRVVHKSPQLNNAYQNFSYAIDPDHYLIGLPSNNGADVLSWTNRVFNSTFEELNTVAGLRPATDSVFVPYLNGERAPIWNEFATGNLYDLTRVSTRESVLFSIMLGMIFNIKHNVELLEELVEFDSIGLVGGITKLESFSQLLADVLGYTLYIPVVENAETLGSIAVVKGMPFENEYDM
ncbi:FGGY family carbohydrate kinase [Ruoffia tabacinasalis]|nr:FGGY family carbohydrate kinase [Ruoffia tabacinasalis]